MWIVLETADFGRHVMPDDEEHDLEDCRCHMQFNEEANAFVHNSFDGREDFETGKRKPS
jgi:hypothetical protein